MTENTSVKLNIQSPNISTVVYAVQNDKLSRHITAQLLDGSAPWTPPAGAGAVIRYLKPDGTGGFYDVDESSAAAVVLSGSVATLTLVEQCVTVPGDVYMQLNFYGTDGSKLTTFAWILRVQKSVLTDATIVSSDYYNVLSAQIGAVLDAAAALTGMTATASGLATGEAPTVTVTGGSAGTPYNLAFGIPAGPVGPANEASAVTTYQAGSSPSTAPTGTWQATPPSVNQGEYLWSRTVVTWASGTPTTYYSVARQGVDGSGAPGTSTPLADTLAGAAGTSSNFSREDHRHPLPLDLIYPVGSIYMSVNSTSPATLFGGTWSQIKDTFLLAAGDTYSAGTTGGEAAHTLTESELPSINGTLTVNKMVGSTTRNIITGASGVFSSAEGSITTGVKGSDESVYSSNVTLAFGGGQAHNNMPPYLAVYMWQRTA